MQDEIKLAEFNVQAFYEIKALLDQGYKMDGIEEENFYGEPTSLTIRMVKDDCRPVLIAGNLRIQKLPFEPIRKKGGLSNVGKMETHKRI